MKWVLAESDTAAAAKLSDQAGLHPLIARLLVSRGIADPAAARSFLSSGLSCLSDPLSFLSMDRAVRRIRDALAGRKQIVVYGDYDVDGVTASALLSLVLRDLGGRVECYIPDRMTEGYGLNADALQKLKASGADLIITVDCGISARNEAALARSLGIDLIITDHHEFAAPHAARRTPKEPTRAPDSRSLAPEEAPVLPDAVAVLHPELLAPDAPEDVCEAVSGLTGVGVAFKLVQALLDVPPDDERLVPYLDLVTLGTVADLGKLSGENRILVKHGLAALAAPGPENRPGIAALKQVAGLNGRQITAGTVGFTLAPRINASGRLESASMALRLLTTDSRQEAAELAANLDAVNRERQAVEEEIWQDARRMCRQMDLSALGALVLASADWHPGVVGIVASRIADEFYRPTALLCVQDGVARGSARSIPGFNLYEGLIACSDLLLTFGGHKYAAGLSVAEDRVPALRERLSSVARERLGPDGFVRKLTVDGSVAIDALTLDLTREIERLGPFGQGNPEPRLGARGLEVVTSRVVGNNHLRLRLRQKNGPALDAIAFNKGSLLGRVVKDGASVAAVFTPRVNTWNGTTAVELEIKDIKPEKQ